MGDKDKTYSIVQAEVPPTSKNIMRKVLGLNAPSHALLSVWDNTANKEIAQLHFSGKNAHGKTIEYAGRHPLNAIRIAADCVGLGRSFEKMASAIAPTSQLIHLKGVFLTEGEFTPIKVDFPQEIRFTGTEDEITEKLNIIASAAEELNGAGVIFSSLGVFNAANNCRAGLKVCCDAANIPFEALDDKATAGSDSRLIKLLSNFHQSSKIQFAVTKSLIEKTDLHATLHDIKQRLRNSVRTTSPSQDQDKQTSPAIV